MERLLTSIGAGIALFAAFSSSSSYNLNSYSIGSAGTSNSHSGTYYTQSAGGEVGSGSTSSPHDIVNAGGVQTEQLSVPLAPTLGNGSGAYYNHLTVTLSNTAGSSNYPTDTTFSIGVSTTNCFTSSCITGGGVKFVQTGGTLNTSQFYQSYSAWGSGSGSTIVGLTPSTTYYVAVAAKQGTFTNTAYGASSNVATVSQSISFSVSPNSLTLSNLLPGSVISSSNVSFGLSTNATFGGTIFDSGKNGGLLSASHGATLPAPAPSSQTTLSGSSHGFGLQGQSASSPLVIDAPYNGTSSTVGGENASYTPIFTTPNAITSGTASLNMQAKAANTDPASTDYQEVMTFVASASF